MAEPLMRFGTTFESLYPGRGIFMVVRPLGRNAGYVGCFIVNQSSYWTGKVVEVPLAELLDRAAWVRLDD